jgi:two-component system response regulator AtoC
LERALIYGEDDEILPADLDLAGGRRVLLADAAANGTSTQAGRISAAAPATSLDSMERDAIERALGKWGGNRSKAAEELGISRRTILNKIKKYGFE